MLTIPVLIIGAGPVGLSLSLALARQNVKSLVIERRLKRAEHPRARGVTMRTMELFHLWGNVADLLKHEQPKEMRRLVWSRSLQGEEITRIKVEDDNVKPYSLLQPGFVTQNYVEDYLFNTTKKYQQAEFLFLNEFTSFEQDDEGVTVLLFNHKTNQNQYVRCQYLIAADGAHSAIRQQLQVPMFGADNLGQYCSVYCEFDISQLTTHRMSSGYFFIDPALSNITLFAAGEKNRWIVAIRFTKENCKDDFTDEYCLKEIRRMIGIPNLDIQIIEKSFWKMMAQVAETYSRARVFLVGDAAHVLPPTGGLGMNTGIQDAHNLAWKLAFVLNHGVSSDLLNTYSQERMPIAKQNIAWAAENNKRFVDIYEAIHTGNMEKLKIKLQEQQQNLSSVGLDLGFVYHSDAITSENQQTLSGTPSRYVPTTLPGSRVPHIFLQKDGEKISSLDLFEKEFVLLVGSAGGEWRRAFDELMPFAFPIKCYVLGSDLIDTQNNWQAIYGMSNTGALLIRPDGHVAWRACQLVEDPLEALCHVFRNWR